MSDVSTEGCTWKRFSYGQRIYDVSAWPLRMDDILVCRLRSSEDMNTSNWQILSASREREPTHRTVSVHRQECEREVPTQVQRRRDSERASATSPDNSGIRGWRVVYWRVVRTSIGLASSAKDVTEMWRRTCVVPLCERDDVYDATKTTGPSYYRVTFFAIQTRELRLN